MSKSANAAAKCLQLRLDVSFRVMTGAWHQSWLLGTRLEGLEAAEQGEELVGRADDEVGGVEQHSRRLG
jgi:hypothetical protein